jgi:hypothetical protein
MTKTQIFGYSAVVVLFSVLGCEFVYYLQGVR